MTFTISLFTWHFSLILYLSSKTASASPLFYNKSSAEQIIVTLIASMEVKIKFLTLKVSKQNYLLESCYFYHFSSHKKKKKASTVLPSLALFVDAANFSWYLHLVYFEILIFQYEQPCTFQGFQHFQIYILISHM